MGALRRLLVPGAVAFILAVAIIPAAASAQSLRDTILSELRQQGYTEITIRRTLLGRTRIVAESDQFYREIVFNPSTGTILRDYWRRKLDSKAQPQILDAAGNAKSGGSGDNSGSGTRTDNSGPGSASSSEDDGSEHEAGDSSDSGSDGSSDDSSGSGSGSDDGS